MSSSPDSASAASKPRVTVVQSHEEINLKRCGPYIHMEKARVLLRRFYPSSHDITRRIVNDITQMTPEEREEQLSIIMDEFGNRHERVLDTYVNRFREVRANLGENWAFDRNTRGLIGAHFMQEYSIESAALFNPSIVKHIDQSGLPDGATRFIVSLRATGEGHISSVEFRTGIVNKHNRVSLDPSPTTIIEAQPLSGDTIAKEQFIQEMNQTHGVCRQWEQHHNQLCQEVLDDLPPQFSIDDLRRACTHLLKQGDRTAAKETVCRSLLLIGEANYTVRFESKSDISQRVLFPSAPTQSNGIEDARFVEFTEDDGKSRYYATFSAYNGRSVLPQLMVTDDFVTFRFMTLVGEVSNKGMALFPRKVNGHYYMLSRQDDVNIMLMSSETMYKWEDPQVVIRPEQPWEIFKMGNCGSPLETPKGWLVLTHGVGPMRRYAIGAVMLDINDPSKIVGRLAEPLIKPNETEREGYVPNVVYTCGAMIHNGIEVIIPYAMSDSVSSFATVSLEALYKRMGLE